MHAQFWGNHTSHTGDRDDNTGLASSSGHCCYQPIPCNNAEADPGAGEDDDYDADRVNGDGYMKLHAPNSTVPHNKWWLDIDSLMWHQVVAVIILVNAVIIGLEVEVGSSAGLEFMNQALGIFFVFELAIRIFVKGQDFFLDKNEQWWNLFDTLVVILAISELFFHLITASSSGGASISGLMRVSRVFRVFRLVRLFHIIPQLKVISQGFGAALTSVVWLCTSLFFIIYFCAIVTTAMIGREDDVQDVKAQYQCQNKYSSANDDEERIEGWFGSLHGSILTLFEMVTLDGWAEVTMVVMKNRGNAWAFFFVAFVMLASFTFMGLLTAQMTDQTISSMHNNQVVKLQEIAQAKQELEGTLGSVFEKMDQDGSGSLTMDEVVQCLSQVHVHEALELAGYDLDESDIRELHRMIDTDGQGKVSSSEFLEGFSKIKGEAQAKDVLTLKYGQVRLRKDLKSMKEEFSKRLEHLEQTQGHVITCLERACGALHVDTTVRPRS